MIPTFGPFGGPWKLCKVWVDGHIFRVLWQCGYFDQIHCSASLPNCLNSQYKLCRRFNVVDDRSTIFSTQIHDTYSTIQFPPYAYSTLNTGISSTLKFTLTFKTSRVIILRCKGSYLLTYNHNMSSRVCRIG